MDGIEGEINITSAIGGRGIIDATTWITGARCVRCARSDTKGGWRGMRWTPIMNVFELSLWSKDELFGFDVWKKEWEGLHWKQHHN